MSHLTQIIKDALESDAFRCIERRLCQDDPEVRIAGPTGGARALTIARSLLACRRSAAVITSSGKAAKELAEELKFLLGALSPDPPPVVLLPAFEVDPYRGLSPHPEIAAARACAFWQMLREGTIVVVAPIQAVAARLPAPHRFLRLCLDLKTGADYDPEDLRNRLLAAGYIEDDPVTEAGEFSLRGGILDVFPPHMETPIRLEFLGDRIESLRRFDMESQRSIERLEHAEIIPMREFFAGKEVIERWADEFPKLWSAPFLPYIEEEIARAKAGETFPGFEFMLPAIDPLEGDIFDYISGYRLILCDREVLEATLAKAQAELFSRYVDRIEAQKPAPAPDQIYLTAEELAASLSRFPLLEIEELLVEKGGKQPLYVASQAVRKYHGNIRQLTDDLGRFIKAGERVVLLFPSLGRAERTRDILGEYGIPCRLCKPGDDDSERGSIDPGVALLGTGSLHAGFFLPGANLRVLTGGDVFDEVDVGPTPLRTRGAQRRLFLSDFRDLKPGDYVVHIDHGIGQFQGLKQMETQEGAKEFMLVTYQDQARLYVPVERLDLIQKYSSVGGGQPSLDRLGGTSWNRTKARIRRSMRDMADELLKLYAQRQMAEGFVFAPDSAWQQEFEDSFEFELTEDQSEAINAVKRDMEAPRPMDRLICGDVGYGKTEVAMRAAFKAVMDGKQVAVLAPTTVLAFQHFNTFRQRFTAFPVRIELLSRFRSPREQKQVVADLETGALDIVIGTHRLLSKDVKFKDLGVVVVDEEQRFGVTHKERLKAMKTKVDVLTLSATPIPRTLHMGLMGLRDMSTIETPPKNRLAIQTSVLKFGPDVIRSAIEMELARNGQVYYVHNRVETIYATAASLQRLAPQARIGVAHGQMSERDLEKVMMRFVMDELDVLVSTTIIENGLDIPRVNTIIIDRADLYGMSQLYQLRGRVGRSDRRAYAYLLIPSDEALPDVARKRLAAIREFSDLGTGFRVAALDLEIRGAGNLLGGEQHGHINSVGFDLYCRLLEQTVAELQGKQPEPEAAASINMNLDIRIPQDYISDQSQRLRMYKRISSARDAEELASLQHEMVDRFGKYPEQVDNLFRYAGLRQQALALQIQSIERSRDQIHIRLMDQSRISPQKLLKLVARNRRAFFSPQGVLTLEAKNLSPAALFHNIHCVLDEIRAC